jgi:putative nucleotidyltransferase with HDIG domain
MVSASSILIVVAESQVRSLLRDRFTAMGFACHVATNGREALRRLEGLPSFDLLLCDVSLSDMTGQDVLTSVLRNHKEIVVIMVASTSESRLAVEALQAGAVDFVVKPFNVDGLIIRVQTALDHPRLRRERQLMQQHLDEQTKENSKQLRHRLMIEQNHAREMDETRKTLRTAYDAILQALALAMDFHDHTTQGHSQRVTAYALELGRQLGVTPAELEVVRKGAMLHDIGNVAVPDAVLHKPDQLTPQEREQIKQHVKYGYQILSSVDFLQDAAQVVRHHHERYDGQGYPDGIAGGTIHLGARIFAVADAFDAMTSDRPYRRARDYRHARAELEQCSGSHFDPRVVETFSVIPPDRWLRLRHQADTSIQDWQGRC